MTQDCWSAVDAYFNERLVRPDRMLEDALAASAAAGLPEIAVAPNQGMLLHLLARALGARSILEIGTLGGYSTIWLARALAEGGRVITLEVDPAHAAVATANIARAGLAQCVEIRVGQALETLPRIAAEGHGPFDLIFIDADKPSTPEYFDWALRLAREGTAIVIDNVVRDGHVIDDASGDASVQGVRRLIDKIAAEPRVQATALQTVGSKGYDGFAVCFVRALAAIALMAVVVTAAPRPAEASTSTAPPEAPATVAAVTLTAPESALELLRSTPSAASLRAWHDLLGSEPHVAGTPGDARTIARIAEAFRAMGLAVEVQEIDPLLCRPQDALVEIVTDETASAAPKTSVASATSAASAASADTTVKPRRGVVSLALREQNLAEDPATAHPDLTIGWNAYSGSGDVTAPVVYANFGTRADFAALRAAGIDVAGRVVLARYGRNFRGDKVGFAEELGAAALLLYIDPKENARGPVYPEGGWANDTCIQRGSILRLGQPGDPLTPGWAATADAPRRALADVALPRIPVQPIGYAAAGEILSRMPGTMAPASWQGGLTLPYRFADPAQPLRVRVKVAQTRERLRTANVIATLPGSEAAEEAIIFGCHHDAWGFGAADPLAGTIALMETAKACAEAAKAGWRPRRSLVFAAWAAEEFGIIGSTEWTEAHAERLASDAVAYVNLDMASMGPNFGAKAAPSLMSAVLDAASRVPQAGEAAESALGAWSRASADGIARVGAIDGGSDHEALQFHLGVPSCSLFAGGGAGTSYHSNYDTLAWYRKVVGETYEPALMVSRVCVELAQALADAPSPPLDLPSIATWASAEVATLESAAIARGMTLDLEGLARAIHAYDLAACAVADEVSRLAAEVGPGERDATNLQGPTPRSRLDILGRAIIDAERAFLRPGPHPAGRRDWGRHTLVGVDPDAGYSAESLPALREALSRSDDDLARRALAELAERFEVASTLLLAARTE